MTDLERYMKAPNKGTIKTVYVRYYLMPLLKASFLGIADAYYHFEDPKQCVIVKFNDGYSKTLTINGCTVAEMAQEVLEKLIEERMEDV